MAYEAEISRAHPTCFLFLVDHSTSMQDPIMGIPENPKKSYFAADAINKVIQSLVVSASKDMDIRKYFQIGVLGYGFDVTSILQPQLTENDLAWIDDIYKNPLRIENRIRKEVDESGLEIEYPTKFPVWIDPVAKGQTPMCAVLKRAVDVLSQWVTDFPDSYPPTVINITDGESNDGDPKPIIEALKDIHTNDGHVILLTVHVSSNPYSEQVFFPDNESLLPDYFSKSMFKMSSTLSPNMCRVASELLGVEMPITAKGFVYNADIAGIVQALEIGTRPANLP